MKTFLLTVATLLTMNTNAWAGYLKLAECHGHTDRHEAARAVLFVDSAKDTQGLIMISMDSGWDYASITKINWRANAQGYPRFFDNDFDLDIVIDDSKSTFDDVLVDNNYISRLECYYTQKN